jgi:hypothetical protein
MRGSGDICGVLTFPHKPPPLFLITKYYKIPVNRIVFTYTELRPSSFSPTLPVTGMTKPPAFGAAGKVCMLIIFLLAR